MRRIVLVKSCYAYHDRQDACRATWAGKLASEGIPLWFAEANYPKTEIRDCWLLLTRGDEYNDNSIKVREAVRLLLKYDPFDLLFVADDNTFVQWRRWLDFWPSKEVCGLKTDKIPWIHGGGGWYMSRKACEVYVAGIKQRCSWDDRLASEILDPHFEFENRPDLFAQWDERVSADNSLITCHNVSPQEMPKLYEATINL